MFYQVKDDVSGLNVPTKDCVKTFGLKSGLEQSFSLESDTVTRTG